MKLSATDALLDSLEAADDRQASAFVDLLATLGDDIGPIVAERLEGARWGVQRLLLLLLGKLSVLPVNFSLREFVRHPEGGVRREALRMMLRRPETRDGAITVALSDTDERVVRLALGASMTGCPPGPARILMTRADDESLPAELRALGVRALSSSRSPEVLQFLVGRTLGKKRFLRRRRLASKSPEMLAALAGLAAHWRDDPAAAAVLDLAAHSSDSDITDAAARRGGAA